MYTKDEKVVFSGDDTQPLLPIIFKFFVTSCACQVLAEIRSKDFIVVNYPLQKLFCAQPQFTVIKEIQSQVTKADIKRTQLDVTDVVGTMK